MEGEKLDTVVGKDKNVDMLITVAVVTYNHGRTLFDCINSITSQIHPKIDLVIVDDFSCDFDLRKVEEYVQENRSDSIKSVTIRALQEHRGINAAYREALDCAKGEYVIFLAGDDCLNNKKVLHHIANVLADDSADILQARAKLERVDDDIVLPSQHAMDLVEENKIFDLFRITVYAPFAQLLCMQSAFFRTEYLRQINAFDCDYQYAVDWPVYAKALFDAARFVDADFLVTRMHDNGAYRVNSVGNLYIKKGYLHDAARAIREFAVQNRSGISQVEILLFETAANSYECLCTRIYDWYTYSISDKRAWRKEHKDFFLMHKACYPDFGARRIPLKKLIFALFAAFILFAVTTMLPSGIAVMDSKIFFLICMGVFGVVLLNNKRKTGIYFRNLNYAKAAIFLLILTAFTAFVKAVDTVSLPHCVLLIMCVLMLMIVCGLAYRVVYKLYCRYASRNCRKGRV